MLWKVSGAWITQDNCDTSVTGTRTSVLGNNTGIIFDVLGCFMRNGMARPVYMYV